MPSRPSSGRTEQVNVRLTTELHEVVQALVFLEGKSAAEVLLPVIRGYLEGQMRSNPSVERLLAEKAEHQRQTDPKDAKVRQLGS